jgi:glyoxylase I family protein
MTLKGLHHISITVKDFDATLAFYAKGFGLTPASAWERGGGERAAMLDLGNGAFLEVFSGRTEAPQEGGIIAHIALATDDCDADFQRALAAGATVQMELTNVSLPGDPPTPIRIAFVKGLDGESIEFFQYL